MITRRQLLKTTAAAYAASIAMPALASGTKIKIGYVTPQSGPLSAFAQADSYMVSKFLESAKALGLDVEVIVKDSQSNPMRGARPSSSMVNQEPRFRLVVLIGALPRA